MFERRYCMNCGKFPLGALKRRCRWFDGKANAKSSTSNCRTARASTPPRTSFVRGEGLRNKRPWRHRTVANMI
jgi:hypothetical protein